MPPPCGVVLCRGEDLNLHFLFGAVSDGRCVYPKFTYATILWCCFVPGRGLEPPCLAAPAPKAGVSTNFTTPAFDTKMIITYYCFLSMVQ